MLLQMPTGKQYMKITYCLPAVPVKPSISFLLISDLLSAPYITQVLYKPLQIMKLSGMKIPAVLMLLLSPAIFQLYLI